MSTAVSKIALSAELSDNKLVWLAPAFAAFAYPYFVMQFYQSGRMLHQASDPSSLAVAWIDVLVAVILTYGVPALSLIVACLLGRVDAPSPGQLRARRFAHLAFASPSLFVLIGVIFYMLHLSNGDYVFWAILWLGVVAAIAYASKTDVAHVGTVARTAPRWLKMSHGFSALAILLIFLAWHLLNHMTAFLSIDANQAMMKVLRKWYRSELVQPLLVALFIFQVCSGLILLWGATAVKSDLLRTLQTITGAYLAVFITSHLNAVFVLGRHLSDVDTTFLWAAGAPTGLLPDAWNVRLVPHYSLAVWWVITHLGLGLRIILLGHGVSATVANRVAWGTAALGLVVASIITAALMSVHGPQG
jgi:hypothetical protein